MSPHTRSVFITTAFSSLRAARRNVMIVFVLSLVYATGSVGPAQMARYMQTAATTIASSTSATMRYALGNAAARDAKFEMESAHAAIGALIADSELRVRAAVAQQVLDTHDKLDKITMRVADQAAVMQRMVDDMELNKATMLTAMGEFSYEQGVLSTRIKMTGDAQQSIRNELLKMQAVAADDNMRRSIGNVDEHDTCKREITELVTKVTRNVQEPRRKRGIGRGVTRGARHADFC